MKPQIIGQAKGNRTVKYHNMDINEIKKLPKAKQILLAQDIWDSLEKDKDIVLSDETKAELDRRIALDDSGTGTYYSLEESRKRNAKLRNGL